MVTRCDQHATAVRRSVAGKPQPNMATNCGHVVRGLPHIPDHNVSTFWPQLVATFWPQRVATVGLVRRRLAQICACQAPTTLPVATHKPQS